MPPEQAVEGILLADSKLTALDTGVVDTEESVNVVHGLCSDVGKFLDLGSDVLDLVVVELEAELFDTRLDGIPSSQTMTT